MDNRAAAGIPVAGDIAAGIAAAVLAVAYINGSIPGTATGGIFSRPQIRMIAEAGPEAVVPLSGGGFGKEEIHIHVDLDGDEVGRAIVRRAR